MQSLNDAYDRYVKDDVDGDKYKHDLFWFLNFL